MYAEEAAILDKVGNTVDILRSSDMWLSYTKTYEAIV